MPLGNSAKLVSRRDTPRRAQRFSVGGNRRNEQVPNGRLKSVPFAVQLAVPPGLGFIGRGAPTRKRWAIIGCPSGTVVVRLCRSTLRKALSLGPRARRQRRRSFQPRATPWVRPAEHVIGSAEGAMARLMKQADGLPYPIGCLSQGVALGWYEPGLRPGHPALGDALCPPLVPCPSSLVLHLCGV